MRYAIEIIDVSKRFREGEVLKNIRYNFPKGQICGLVGRNGFGKTILLKCICGLEKITSGKILVQGQDIKNNPPSLRDIGAIIETPGFLPNYSGRKNLQFLASINKKIKKEDITHALQLVGLDPALKKWVGKYSLGMKQRLGIAQAIMEKPSILLLDEPMNGLDIQGIDEMRSLFKRLSEEGTTIIIATHVEEDIHKLCDDLIYMNNGIAQIGGSQKTDE